MLEANIKDFLIGDHKNRKTKIIIIISALNISKVFLLLTFLGSPIVINFV